MAALRYGRLQSADGTLGRPALVLFANTPNVSSVANFADAGRVAGPCNGHESSVRPSICPSVCPVDRQQQRRVAGLLLKAGAGAA